MSRMAAELAFIPQALSEGKNERRGDGSATNNYSSSTLSLCVPARERDVFLACYAWYGSYASPRILTYTFFLCLYFFLQKTCLKNAFN